MKPKEKITLKLGFFLKFAPLLFFSIFSFASGADIQTPNTVNDIFYIFTEGNLTGFLTVLITVGMVTFLAGVVKFVGAGDNEEKRSQGRMVMIYGIVVMFVIFGMWGFVNILTQSFFGENAKTPDYLPDLL